MSVTNIGLWLNALDSLLDLLLLRMRTISPTCILLCSALFLLPAYVFWHRFACLSFSRAAALTALLSWLSSVETHGSLVPGSLPNSNRCGLNLVEVCGVARLYSRKKLCVSFHASGGHWPLKTIFHRYHKCEVSHLCVFFHAISIFSQNVPSNLCYITLSIIQ